jgi:hypothetical protein
MKTQISSKLAAFAVALMMNSLIIGGVTYLFDGQMRQHSTSISQDRTTSLGRVTAGL